MASPSIPKEPVKHIPARENVSNGGQMRPFARRPTSRKRCAGSTAGPKKGKRIEDMGVRIREKPKDSGVWWVFIHHEGRRTSRRVGDQEAAEEVARQIQARLTLGRLSNRFSVIFFRACREELLHLFFPAGQVQVLPAG